MTDIISQASDYLLEALTSMILIITNTSLPPKDYISKYKVRIHNAVESLVQN